MKRWEFERAVLGSDLSAPARLILLALAVLADWPGGVIPAKFSPSLSTLQVMTGLSRSALATHLNAIERVAGRDGWVVRARPTKRQAQTEKERTRYRLSIPASARDALASASHGLASAGDGLGLVREVDRASAGGGHKPDHFQTYSQTAAKQQSPSSPEQIVIDATGATAEEAAAVANRVANERKPRSLPGLLRRMATDGDLTQLLADQRAAAKRATVADALEAARRGPECEHRVPGGAALHPTTRQPLCPHCRTQAQRNGLKVVSA
ncbi:hypothetical protein MED01_004250 [Micromonospora sp. MED01]|uniref:hypothetical protein n=1 Tax=Micromonospora alfalfae TaxID=2911212 RepID=UPI001EE985F5|nr:hypothetical protein [Micromonospora alfalfae]MCG5460824.1 hypothetical protein [Micromonospora alfalfae]